MAETQPATLAELHKPGRGHGTRSILVSGGLGQVGGGAGRGTRPFADSVSERMASALSAEGCKATELRV